MVIDTNCVVSALLFEHGRLAWLRDAWKREVIIPLADRATLHELIRVLGYPRFRLAPADQETLLAEYLPWVEVLAEASVLPGAWPDLQDPDDAKFLHLAVSAGAEYLVSGDRDLLSMRDRVPGLNIVKPAELRERV